MDPCGARLAITSLGEPYAKGYWWSANRRGEVSRMKVKVRRAEKVEATGAFSAQRIVNAAVVAGGVPVYSERAK
ncbi:hypothetical protein GCM10012283_08350 [Phycicoccus endophyticus]|nr:hypothetical protein GCM10012283_08350 [Phycicoccus endophyticus]